MDILNMEVSTLINVAIFAVVIVSPLIIFLCLCDEDVKVHEDDKQKFHSKSLDEMKKNETWKWGDK